MVDILYQDAKRRGTYLVLFTDPEGDGCFCIYQVSWRKMRKVTFCTGLLIFRGKNSKISRDFQGQIRGKIGRFRGIFAGEKSKFTEKSADFAGF